MTARVSELTACSKTRIPRLVFIYWAQGWQSAPEICKVCRTSWEAKSGDFRVVALSKDDLKDWCDVQFLKSVSAVKPIQAQSDLIRMYLLHKYGGVWVDATMLALRSLEEVIPIFDFVDDFWCPWDIDSDLPTINFMIAARPHVPFLSVSASEIVSAENPYHSVNLVFRSKLGDSRKAILLERQPWPCEKSRRDARRGFKIIANSFTLMDAAADKPFREVLETVPFLKLSWKYTYRNLPIEDSFLPDSCLRLAVGSWKHTSRLGRVLLRLRRKMLHCIAQR